VNRTPDDAVARFDPVAASRLVHLPGDERALWNESGRIPECIDEDGRIGSVERHLVDPPDSGKVGGGSGNRDHRHCNDAGSA
jgi:hypothetical protein